MLGLAKTVSPKCKLYLSKIGRVISAEISTIGFPMAISDRKRIFEGDMFLGGKAYELLLKYE